MSFRVCAASDIHGSSVAISNVFATAKNNKADLIIISGDICCNILTRDFICCLKELAEYAKCACTLVFGNHDYASPYKVFSLTSDVWPNTSFMPGVNTSRNPVVYLQESSWEWKGVKLWGSPYVPYIDGKWNYERKRNEEKFEIPDDTDVVITHTPPYGYGDQLANGNRIGSEELAMKISMNPNIKLVICGHNHNSGGWQGKLNNTIICNCAMFNEDLTKINYSGLQIIDL
jgi:Icc-related predicted phosphoesterase